VKNNNRRRKRINENGHGSADAAARARQRNGVVASVSQKNMASVSGGAAQASGISKHGVEK
jgi:hypothetical protein